MAKETVTVTDNRPGKTYELPIENGCIRSMDLRQIKKDPQDFGLMAYDPTVEVHRAAAEQLPFEDDSFDAAVAQLVVHFMADPIAGLREMARVTRPDGVVAACVWDHQGGSGPLSLFWRAVHDLDASFAGEAGLAGAGDGQLVRLFREAGLRQVEQHLLWVAVEHESFEEWWEPFTLGVGPAGAYVAGLDAAGRARLREQCYRLAPAAPFVVEAAAWAARAVV